LTTNELVFTVLRAMQTRTSDEKAVCLSVCQTRGLSQNRRNICPDFYTKDHLA